MFFNKLKWEIVFFYIPINVYAMYNLFMKIDTVAMATRPIIEKIDELKMLLICCNFWFFIFVI